MGKKNYGSVYGLPYQRYRYLLKYLDNYYKEAFAKRIFTTTFVKVFQKKLHNYARILCYKK